MSPSPQGPQVAGEGSRESDKPFLTRAQTEAPPAHLQGQAVRGYRYRGATEIGENTDLRKAAIKVGQRFGSLMIAENLGVGRRQRWWGCVCDCGSKVAIRTPELIRYGVSHCGCLQQPKKACLACDVAKPREEFPEDLENVDGKAMNCATCCAARDPAWKAENPEKALAILRLASNKYRARDLAGGILRRLRNSAKRRGLAFTLTAADIRIPDVCPVLGVPLRTYVGKNIARGPIDDSVSFDRIDNNKGYTPDNIIVISHRANRLKNNSTPDELRRIADFFDNLEARRAEDQERLVSVFTEQLGSEVGARAALKAANDAGWTWYRPETLR